MKILLGKYLIYWTRSVNGAHFGEWKILDIPREGTASLETDDGNKVEAKDDWGKTVDSYTDPGTSTLSFELYKKKGLALPFEDIDGVIAEEYAFRIVSAIDPSAPGFQIDRASLSAKRSWGKEDSYRVSYTATTLEPATGAMVKDLGVDISANGLEFTAEADSTGKTITIENHNGTLSVSTEAAWITTNLSDDSTPVLTVTVQANSTTSERIAEVIIADSTGFSATLLVSQAAATEGD